MITRQLLTSKHIIVQGITGSQGAFHTKAMKQAGTTIVAGTSPNKAGEFIDGIPVYATIASIQADTPVDATVIFVPPAFAKAAIVEAIDAKIPLIVCITEGIPIHDMLYIKHRIEKSSSELIGPNCPGILLPGGNKLGIIPSHLSMPGTVGIVSRSGTLTYEAMDGLTRHGIGQKYVIGIGGDRVQGTSFIDALQLFQNDPDVDVIVMIGEIGGSTESTAADYIKASVTKPVFGYITGHHAPAGVQLGHAGAILGGAHESASAKTEYLRAAGVVMSTNITALIDHVVAAR